jgi:hypothetical protein
MTGERDLSRLQRDMAPQMHSETFVYCNFPDFEIPPGMSPICTFREAEGLTVIVEKGQAEHRAVEYVFEARLITLTVHSSLEAVGFLPCWQEAWRRLAFPATPSPVITTTTCSYRRQEPARRSRCFRRWRRSDMATPSAARLWTLVGNPAAQVLGTPRGHARRELDRHWERARLNAAPQALTWRWARRPAPAADAGSPFPAGLAVGVGFRAVAVATAVRVIGRGHDLASSRLAPMEVMTRSAATALGQGRAGR